MGGGVMSISTSVPSTALKRNISVGCGPTGLWTIGRETHKPSPIKHSINKIVSSRIASPLSLRVFASFVEI